MNEGEGFDSEGVALDNPHLRRVGTFSDEEVRPVGAVPGVWIPLEADVSEFKMRVPHGGVFMVFHLEDGSWGIEWVQDE